MGEPNKKSKSKSCAYDGEDIKYVYDEFTLVTYTEKNGAEKRKAAEVELGRIEGELKQKLLELRG